MRTVLSLASILDFEIATADFKGAYMQSGPINDYLYVRPPKQISERLNTVWKLLRLLYGVVEARRQWLCADNNWLLNEYNAEHFACVEQLFYKNGEQGRTVLVIAKDFNDFLIA